MLRVSVRPDADAELRVLSYSSTRAGIAAHIETPQGPLTLTSPLFGAHNLENLLVTIGVCLSLEIALIAISEALLMAVGAPGRMERVHEHARRDGAGRLRAHSGCRSSGRSLPCAR